MRFESDWLLGTATDWTFQSALMWEVMMKKKCETAKTDFRKLTCCIREGASSKWVSWNWLYEWSICLCWSLSQFLPLNWSLLQLVPSINPIYQTSWSRYEMKKVGLKFMFNIQHIFMIVFKCLMCCCYCLP